MKTLLLSFLFLTGCASTGPTQTFPQNLAYAYATHTAILQATTAAVGGGVISSADASQILVLEDQAKVILDGAATLATNGSLTEANNKLALALSALTAVQVYLNNHQGK